MSDTELINKLMAQSAAPANLYELLRSHDAMKRELQRLAQRIEELDQQVCELKSQRFEDSLV